MLLKKTGLLFGLFLFIEKENNMSYKYSKGSQIIGDLKAADDTQRDTLIDFGEDYIGLQTSGSVRMVISGSDGKVGIGVAVPSYKLDIDGDIRIRGNDIRDNSGNKAITFDGSANTSVVNDLTVGGNVFDANNKSVIKLVDHGACLINEANTSQRYLPDDIFHDYDGSNLYTTNAPPFSGSVDRLVVRGVNSSDLSLLGDLTAKVRIAGEGVDGYDVDNDGQCSSIESVTISSANLGSNKNCVFNFTASNFTPQDVYAITLTPTNNWTSISNGAYINFTIVTSYIID